MNVYETAAYLLLTGGRSIASYKELATSPAETRLDFIPFYFTGTAIVTSPLRIP
jgi:hypothetical protein